MDPIRPKEDESDQLLPQDGEGQTVSECGAGEAMRSEAEPYKHG